MSTILTIADYDVVFLSYDEPNADANWEDLLTKVPHAKRVHGIKGSDSAHKFVAQLATTDRVVIIDADNLVNKTFFNQVIELDGSVDPKECVLSWPSYNIINGLQYGNGGIKCWPRQLILDIRTHENAEDDDPATQVDFCWHVNYVSVEECFSEIHNNASPLQAWRAGFREGVKMSLDRGSKVTDISHLWDGNLKRLGVWMMAGMDVPNGEWAILGARQGCYLTNFTDWDPINVRDFEYLNNYWKETFNHLNKEEIHSMIDAYGHLLELNQLELGSPFDAQQSRFFKFYSAI